MMKMPKRPGKKVESVTITPVGNGKFQVTQPLTYKTVKDMVSGVIDLDSDAIRYAMSTSTNKTNLPVIVNETVQKMDLLERQLRTYRKSLEEAGYDPDSTMRAFRKAHGIKETDPALPGPTEATQRMPGVVVDPDVVAALTRADGVRIGWDRVILQVRDGVLVIKKAESEVLTPQR